MWRWNPSGLQGFMFFVLVNKWKVKHFLNCLAKHQIIAVTYSSTRLLPCVLGSLNLTATLHSTGSFPSFHIIIPFILKSLLPTSYFLLLFHAIACPIGAEHQPFTSDTTSPTKVSISFITLQVPQWMNSSFPHFFLFFLTFWYISIFL